MNCVFGLTSIKGTVGRFSVKMVCFPRTTLWK